MRAHGWTASFVTTSLLLVACSQAEAPALQPGAQVPAKVDAPTPGPRGDVVAHEAENEPTPDLANAKEVADEAPRSKRPPPSKGQPDAEARAEAWTSSLKPACARDNVQAEGIEDEHGPALWFAWAFEGTEPDMSECQHDTLGVVTSREGQADNPLTCVEGVDGGDLGADGWWEAVILEVDCASGMMGGVYPQVWADRPGGPVQLKIAWPGGRSDPITDTRWEVDDADRDLLIFVTNKEGDSMDPPEALDREWSLVLDGERVVPRPYVPAD